MILPTCAPAPFCGPSGAQLIGVQRGENLGRVLPVADLQGARCGIYNVCQHEPAAGILEVPVNYRCGINLYRFGHRRAIGGFGVKLIQHQHVRGAAIH